MMASVEYLIWKIYLIRILKIFLSFCIIGLPITEECGPVIYATVRKSKLWLHINGREIRSGN